MAGEGVEAGGHWFEPLAAHMGEAYLRYSFTKGTEQEVAFVVDALGLRPGMRVLDVGCGPGRHAHLLAERGITVHGIDISERFIELARDAAPNRHATFERLDARALPFDAEFDAAISLCEGAFGLVGEDDGAVLAGMARAVRPGGRVLLTAFSAYFQLRYLDEATDDVDVAAGVNRNTTTVKDGAGNDLPCLLYTSIFTTRELRLMAAAAGLEVEALHSVSPGDYAERPPTLDHPELLLVARRP